MVAGIDMAAGLRGVHEGRKWRFSGDHDGAPINQGRRRQSIYEIRYPRFACDAVRRVYVCKGYNKI
jgi:hypothetical protein